MRPHHVIFKQCVLIVLIECSVGLLYDTSINGPFMSVNAVGRDYGISAPALVIWKVVSPTSTKCWKNQGKNAFALRCIRRQYATFFAICNLLKLLYCLCKSAVKILCALRSVSKQPSLKYRIWQFNYSSDLFCPPKRQNFSNFAAAKVCRCPKLIEQNVEIISSLIGLLCKPHVGSTHLPIEHSSWKKVPFHPSPILNPISRLWFPPQTGTNIHFGNLGNGGFHEQLHGLTANATSQRLFLKLFFFATCM